LGDDYQHEDHRHIHNFFQTTGFFFMADDRSKKGNRTENTIILAPHMFVGVLLTHTHFLKGVLKLMSWAWK
jgi:hypothetical protein